MGVLYSWPELYALHYFWNFSSSHSHAQNWSSLSLHSTFKKKLSHSSSGSFLALHNENIPSFINIYFTNKWSKYKCGSQRISWIWDITSFSFEIWIGVLQTKVWARLRGSSTLLINYKYTLLKLRTKYLMCQNKYLSVGEREWEREWGVETN